MDNCEKVADSGTNKAPLVDSRKNPMDMEVKEHVASVVAQIMETHEQITCTREQITDVEVEECAVGVMAQVVET